MFKAYQSRPFFPLQLHFFPPTPRKVLCQRDISPHNKHVPKLPRFMLRILKQSSKSGYPLKLLNGTKQKSLKNKCDLNCYLCQTLHRNPLSQNRGHEGPCARTCVLKWVAVHPCMYCMCVYGLERERGSHKTPWGVSVGQHCGVSSSACGIPSVYPSASCPSKEAWNTLWLPWQETRARSALWLTSWPSAKPSSHDSFRRAQGEI